MREKEVKKIIGSSNWDKFLEWMKHQTIGMYSNGDTNWYECDVMAFKSKLDKGYDRQSYSEAWD